MAGRLRIALGTVLCVLLPLRVGAAEPATVGDRPENAAVDAFTGNVYVANTGAGTVSVLAWGGDPLLATIDVAAVAPQPFDTGIGPGGRVYVTSAEDSLAIVDTRTNTVLGAVPAGGSGGRTVLADLSGARVYVSTSAGVRLFTATDTAPYLTAVADWASDAYPYGLAHTATGLVVALEHPGEQSGEIVVLDAATLLPLGISLPTGAGPAEIVADPETALVWTADFVGHTLTIVDVAVPTVVATLPVGFFPESIDVLPEERRVFVNLVGEDRTVIVDADSFEVRGSLPGGRAPQSVALDPLRRTAYVVDWGDELVQAIVLHLAPGPNSFGDDNGHFAEAAANALAAAGITSGVSPGIFAPGDTVTRAQMAVFLARALSLVPGPNAFTDDAGHWAEDAIDALARAAITGGCGGNVFCPDAPVTRGQMAVFLQRAFRVPDVAADSFTDDDGHYAEAAIDALATRDITAGCGGTNFCPDQAMTRGEMAVLLVRALAV